MKPATDGDSAKLGTPLRCLYCHLGNPLSQHATGVEATLFQACSARNAGLTENAIYSGHFDGKCHFIWLNHANNGAHFSRKPLIL